LKDPITGHPLATMLECVIGDGEPRAQGLDYRVFH